jgi:hypothetical protein
MSTHCTRIVAKLFWTSDREATPGDTLGTFVRMDGILELLGSTSSLRDTLYELVSGSELGGAVQIGRGCARSRGGPDAEEGVAKHANPMVTNVGGLGPRNVNHSLADHPKLILPRRVDCK